MQNLKTIEVVAAIITHGDRIFATQRGYGEFKDRWEFPGGKVEPGEDREAALVREIREELATEVTVDSFLCTIEYDYPQFHLVMHNYLCSVKAGHLTLLEHEAAKWVTLDQIQTLDWLPADQLIFPALKQRMGTLQNRVESYSFPEKDQKSD